MKAKRKGTNGEWQEVQSVILADNEWTIIKAEEIEFHQDILSTELKTYDLVDRDEHWQDLRERAAIAAMQGVMNFFGSLDYNKETIAKLAVEQADELVKQLKGE